MYQPKIRKAKREGFTIIEVVLVLAIAGLILLMVFVALPSLQRSQRDTQRRNDMGRLITAVQNYQANNANKSPINDAKNALATDFIEHYLQIDGDTFNDPSTSDPYVFKVDSCSVAAGKDTCTSIAETTDDPYTIYTYVGARCNGETVVPVNGNNRLAFTIKLEGAGTYCVDI